MKVAEQSLLLSAVFKLSMMMLPLVELEMKLVDSVSPVAVTATCCYLRVEISST